jgi:PAS domain S-box-containing protein
LGGDQRAAARSVVKKVTSLLRILLLEDDPADAALVEELLESDNIGCEVTLARTRTEYLRGLEDPAVNLILADYQLPSFDGLSALQLAQNKRPGLPFIFVSGTLGEEVAIEALKIGATDYVLKSRLSRLTPSVRRALREASERAQRERAEEALRRSEMYLAEAQGLSRTGSFGWEISSAEIYWSDETYRIFEMEPTTKPTVQVVLDRTHPEDRLYVRQVIERIALERRGFSVEHRLRMPDGSVKHVCVVARRAASEDPERVLLIGAVMDVTERKRAEEALRERADLLNLTHDAIFVCDMDGIVRSWNRGAEALYGWAAMEAEGRPISELLKTVSPTPLDCATAELLRTGRWEGELVRSRKDGTQVVVASRWSLQRDTRGTPVAALETNNDITERRRAEQQRERLRQLEGDLARINRVSMMGELAASLAHEIKQPIAGIAATAGAVLSWLRRKPPELEEACESASHIINGAHLAARIVDRNRALYSREKTQRELIDLNEIIREMAVMLRDTAHRHSISIRSELDPTLPTTTADRVQLQQVVMNLMLNGIEAMKEESGELRVTSTRTEDGELVITVSDSGIGLPEAGPERIFEAFFTTKPDGTGVGLSISRRIIESHGGRLWAGANAGRGATFKFTLPIGS